MKRPRADPESGAIAIPYYAADGTIDQFHEPAQRIAARIDALIRGT